MVNKINKLIIIGVLVLIIFTGSSILNYKEVETMEKLKVYQGPVRPTDNEEHFRLTGQTIPLE